MEQIRNKNKKIFVMRQIYLLSQENTASEFCIAFIKYFKKRKNLDHSMYDFCHNVYYENSLQQMSIASTTNLFFYNYWKLVSDDSCVLQRLGESFWFSVLEHVEKHHDESIVSVIRRDWCDSKKLTVFDHYHGICV